MINMRVEFEHKRLILILQIDLDKRFNQEKKNLHSNIHSINYA